MPDRVIASQAIPTRLEIKSPRSFLACSAARNPSDCSATASLNLPPWAKTKLRIVIMRVARRTPAYSGNFSPSGSAFSLGSGGLQKGRRAAASAKATSSFCWDKNRLAAAQPDAVFGDVAEISLMAVNSSGDVGYRLSSATFRYSAKAFWFSGPGALKMSLSVVGMPRACVARSVLSYCGWRAAWFNSPPDLKPVETSFRTPRACGKRQSTSATPISSEMPTRMIVRFRAVDIRNSYMSAKISSQSWSNCFFLPPLLSSSTAATLPCLRWIRPYRSMDGITLES